MSALQGKHKVLMFRKLGDTNAAGRLMYQTEHETTYKNEPETEATKDGSISAGGVFSSETSFDGLIALDDAVEKMLETAMKTGDTLEMWEISVHDLEAEAHPATYHQGLLTEFSRSYPVEGSATYSGSWKTNLIPQDGQATLTAEQMELLQYAFTDVTEK